jgi:hypothetical protein
MPSPGFPSVAGVALAAAGINITVADANAAKLAANWETTLSAYNADGGIYSTYQLRMYYRDKANVLQMPNATPAGGAKTCSIVQWADPTDDVVMEWSATKSGEWPSVPDKDIGDPNLVYYEGQHWPDPPTVGADGSTLIFRFTGKYYYWVIDPAKLIMRTGLPPWMNETARSSTVVPTIAFDKTIMKTIGGSGNAGEPVVIVPAGGAGGFGPIK